MNRHSLGILLGLFFLAPMASVGRADERPSTIDARIDRALDQSITKGSRLSKRDDVALKPLWSRLGGEPVVTAIVHDFVVKAAGDPKVDFTRGGKYPIDAQGVARLEATLVQLISVVGGGPVPYTGEDLKAVHAGMGITEAQFTASIDDLIDILKSHNIPARELDELVGIIESTRKVIVEPSKPRDPTALWSRLGGGSTVKAIIHDFVLKAAADARVDFTRGGKYTIDGAGLAQLEKKLVEQISAASGGPMTYTGQAMKPAHEGMGITEAQFGAMTEDLVNVLEAYRVPRKEIDELLGLIATTKGDIVEAPK